MESKEEFDMDEVLYKNSLIRKKISNTTETIITRSNEFKFHATNIMNGIDYTKSKIEVEKQLDIAKKKVMDMIKKLDREIHLELFPGPAKLKFDTIEIAREIRDARIKRTVRKPSKYSTMGMQ